ncbi:DoxX family protein [Pseudomonas qingdaonensis]|uniref:DoxX family protein n=1 Tax=Pseudomonas qingdaonensis TaxID=2056231 RepID=UPI002430287A|nr:DoxX family protein [Pseudomonas qingdaonensis]MEC6742921.1 DoxX family protein [Pseudomonas qingdaonensis]
MSKGRSLTSAYKTCLVAGVLGIFTIVTALVFHHNQGDQNQFIHFFKNISIAGGMFQVFVFGGSALSLDARLSRKAFQSVSA